MAELRGDLAVGYRMVRSQLDAGMFWCGAPSRMSSFGIV
jgi:hypothetical protein